jgi:predicted RND superfamily exporter protein
MLETQDQLSDRESLYVSDTTSAARMVAREIDPAATTIPEQRLAIKQATPGQLDRAIRTVAATEPGFQDLVSDDFNHEDASASATLATVSHELPAGFSDGAGESGKNPLTPIQKRIKGIVDDPQITVIGSGIVSEEFATVLMDSLVIVVPAAILGIMLVLVFMYRSIWDFCLTVLSLLMAVIWTFGFMGWVGIAITPMMVAIPSLLLGEGTDFGLHILNRYSEERADGKLVGPAMQTTTASLMSALLLVTTTDSIGFAANFISQIHPVRDFGLVAASTITFEFFIFGVFLPATKVVTDRLRKRYRDELPRPEPLGAKDTPLGAMLSRAVSVTTTTPVVFLLLVVLVVTGAGWYALGVDTSFDNDDFQPNEKFAEQLEVLPGPLAPSEYETPQRLSYVNENFEQGQGKSVIIYVEGPMETDTALERLHRASRDPPPGVVRTENTAEAKSILSVIQAHAERNPEFERLVRRNDANDNGIPDDNLGMIYDRILDSENRQQALRYIGDNRQSARIIFSVNGDTDTDTVVESAKALTEHYWYSATATGEAIVFHDVANLLFESAMYSLVVSILGATAFLAIVYYFRRHVSLALVVAVPVTSTVILVAAGMRLLGIPFNALTATIHAVIIGIGIDYAVHVVHRYIEERGDHTPSEAITLSVRTAGSALFGSMVTTSVASLMLTLALFPAITQFGFVSAMGITGSFMSSVLILPPTLLVWDHYVARSYWSDIDHSENAEPTTVREQIESRRAQVLATARRGVRRASGTQDPDQATHYWGATLDRYRSVEWIDERCADWIPADRQAQVDAEAEQVATRLGKAQLRSAQRAIDTGDGLLGRGRYHEAEAAYERAATRLEAARTHLDDPNDDLVWIRDAVERRRKRVAESDPGHDTATIVFENLDETEVVEIVGNVWEARGWSKRSHSSTSSDVTFVTSQTDLVDADATIWVHHGSPIELKRMIERVIDAPDSDPRERRIVVTTTDIEASIVDRAARCGIDIVDRAQLSGLIHFLDVQPHPDEPDAPDVRGDEGGDTSVSAD